MSTSFLTLCKCDPLRTELVTWLKTTFSEIDILETDNPYEARQLVQTHTPEFAIAVVGLRQAAKIPVISKLKRASPTTQIIILSTYEDIACETKFLWHGATTYVPMNVMGTGLKFTLLDLMPSSEEDKNEVGYSEKELKCVVGQT